MKIGFVVCFCFLIFFIVGCEDNQGETSVQTNAEEKAVEAKLEPLSFSDETFMFESSYGWLDNDTILYSAKREDEHYLFSYHLPSKEKKELFTTREIIAQASVSPNSKYILVYAASNNTEASIHFLDGEGNQQYSVSIPSSELSFAWNPFSEDTLLIDSFYEDWTYKTYVCNVKQKTLEEVTIPQPFAQWYAKEDFLFLKWDDNSPQLSAPLMKYNKNSYVENSLSQNVIAFEANKEVLFTINESKEDQNNLFYTVSDWKGNELNKWEIPAIRSYSDWMIPEFDIIEDQKSIIAFVPYDSALIDQYDKQFQLISYNWETGEREVLMEDMESAPLIFSPEGNKCLYGNTLENIIEF